MNNIMIPASWYSSWGGFANQTFNQVSFFLPRLAGALLVLVLGAFIAKAIKRIVVKILETFRMSSALKNTPIEHFVENAEVGQRVEDVVGSIVYWLAMLIVVHTSVTLLGLEPLSIVLAKVIDYLPNIISAVLVLFFGTLLAGVVESVVKGAIKTIDGHSSRVLGKISSYLVVSLAVMAAVSELGIASEFILILFVGMVTMLSLGGGLALGLGGQDLVKKTLNRWYDRLEKEVRE